ncbi:MAG TPA: hypothetical protein VMT95_12620 [Candidatus Binatia bacterium]|nr:hypothetical protein [Candidatus Binatia bacterium]
MKFALTAASGVLAAAMLAACGGLSSSQVSSSGSSWLAPAAKSAGRLFETDPGTGYVDIFSLPQMKLTQQIKGLKFPTGACSNLDGNVWVGNYSKHEMREYSSAGKLVHTIKGARLDPYACALNPVNFSLAVTDFDQYTFEVGKILIYTVPGSPPTILRNPDVAEYLFPAFDPFGDLWVTGYSTAQYPIISKCGASRCSTVKLRGGSIFSPGPIVWDNVHGNWIIFDNFCHESTTTCSYPVSKDGVVGTPTTYLNSAGGALCSMVQAAIVQTGQRAIAVVGGDSEYSCIGYKNSSVDLWAYPAGGVPVSHSDSVVFPWGAAVSP